MEFDFDLLEQAEAGQEIKAVVTDDERDKLLQLLYRTAYDCDHQKFLSLQVNNCIDADELMLLRRQILMNIIEDKDRIAFGFTYNMNDINECIRYMNKTARKIELKKL